MIKGHKYRITFETSSGKKVRKTVWALSCTAAERKAKAILSAKYPNEDLVWYESYF